MKKLIFVSLVACAGMLAQTAEQSTTQSTTTTETKHHGIWMQDEKAEIQVVHTWGEDEIKAEEQSSIDQRG